MTGNWPAASSLRTLWKNEAKDAIDMMKKQGLVTAMFTGDSKESARAVAGEAGIDKVFAQLLPQDKLAHLQEMRRESGAVLFVGDGINDAPVLAGADVGLPWEAVQTRPLRRQTWSL